MTVFSGNANPQIARLISQHLGLPLGQALIGHFSDGEINVQLKENVRGKDVFFIQPTCAPTNDNLMELMIMVDALKRSSAERITAVMPYFGYSRQDRRPRSARVPISAKVVANMLTGAGVDRVLTIDLHADQIQGFFDIPVDNIYATPILLNDLLSLELKDPVVVSPDIGGVQKLYSRRRYGRYGRHPRKSRQCIETARGKNGSRLLHPPGLVGQCSTKYYRFGLG